MSEENYVLELEHIRKEYPGVVALKDVTLQRTLSSKFLEFILVLNYIKFMKKIFLICQESNCICL